MKQSMQPALQVQVAFSFHAVSCLMRIAEGNKVQILARCGNRRAGDRPRGPAPGLAPLAAVKAVKVAQSGPVQNFPKDSSEFRKTTREYCDQMIRNPRRNPVACVCGPGPALAICFMCVSVSVCVCE